MKIKLYTLLALAFTTAILAQNPEDKTTYLDSLFAETTFENHYYVKVIENHYKKQSSYKAKTYLKTGTLHSEAYFSDKDALSNAGVETIYYTNGNKKSQSNYEKSKPIGRFLSWYENGNRKVEGEHFIIEKADVQETVLKINQFWDSNNNQNVVDGNGYYDEIEKSNIASGKIKNGLRDSIWTGINNEHKFRFTETYENGLLKSGTSIDSKNISHNYKKVMQQPESEKGMKDFYTYVMKNFKIPEEESINGKVMVAFLIDENAKIVEAKIEKSLHPAVDDEALRIIHAYPNWKVAELRGVKIKAWLRLPISIQNGN